MIVCASMLHDNALSVGVNVLELFGGDLLLVLDLLGLGFLGEVQLEVLEVSLVEVGFVSFQHVEFSTEGTSIFSLSLQFHQTSYTEDVVTRQSDGLDGDGRADGTEVVVDLGHKRQQSFGHDVHHCLGQRSGSVRTSSNEGRERLS